MTDDATAADKDTTPTPKSRRGRKGDPELLARMAALGARTQPAAAEPAPPRKPATRRRTTPVTAPSETTRTANTGHAATTRPAPAEKPATRKPAARNAPRAAPMPAEQPKPVAYSSRINLTTTPEQNRALDLARVEDGIDKTARLRAMIALWQDDERLRRRIDKLAKSWR